MTSAQDWIARLAMTPVGVGGWFAAAMGSDESVPASALPARFTVDHHLYSSNWYLLDQGQHLQLHRLAQDEVWFFHTGAPVTLHVFGPDYPKVSLGPDPVAGQSYHGVAPHSTWFGGELARPGFALVSCSLSPGYDPSDSAVPTEQDLTELLATHPAQSELISRLATPSPPATSRTSESATT
jgi:predicted cupin superfamily sugar epimerase